MKKALIQILIYVAGIIAACLLAAMTRLLFLKPGDFSVQAQMMIIAFMSGFYILTFVPLVVVTHILLRKVRPHLWLPLWAIPTFGAIFPWLGKIPFHQRYWPEEPIDMEGSHLVVFSLLALFSISLGVFFTFLSNKRLAHKRTIPAP